MAARIYQPAKSAMQSGRSGRSSDWILEFPQQSQRSADPLMGWTGSGDTQAQVRLRFESQAAAEAYATEKGIAYDVTLPHARKPNVRVRGYGENFATDRKEVWTH